IRPWSLRSSRCAAQLRWSVQRHDLCVAPPVCTILVSCTPRPCPPNHAARERRPGSVVPISTGGALMDSTQSLARRAGLLYVLAGSTAPFAYLYVPDTLLQGDALAIADRVRASESLLRAAIICELYGATLLVFAALALYRLFRSVDQKTATLMAVMILVSWPISYVNALSHIGPLVLLKSPAIAAVLAPGQVAAPVTLFLRLHNYGLVVNQIFWGLWLFPIGALVMRSGFMPRWLGYPLFFAGAG